MSEPTPEAPKLSAVEAAAGRNEGKGVKLFIIVGCIVGAIWLASGIVRSVGTRANPATQPAGRP